MFRISATTIGRVKNNQLRDYACRYVEIADDLVDQIQQQVRVSQSGVSFAADELPPSVHKRNNDCSLSYGWLSPSCISCAKGLGCVTFFLSLACNRDCFFCFNPNQQGYNRYQSKCHDLIAALDSAKRAGADYCDIALTGGEPLMFPDKALAFFHHARNLFPDARLRLYTNGDFATTELMEELVEAGLDEIRFSVKQNNVERGYAHDPVIETARKAKKTVPAVVIEMPVLPNDEINMRELLSALDRAGIDGVNLLELCYPFHRWDEYERRGYSIKNPPYRIPNQYGYAGGLPVAGSEETALDIMAWAAREKLRMGLHYCSLENKFTSEIYLKNHPYRDSFGFMVFSPRDYYLKTAKAFGEDIPKVRSLLNREQRRLVSSGLSESIYEDKESNALWFHPSLIPVIASPYPSLEIALGYHVVDEAQGAIRLREVALDIIDAETFDQSVDL